MRNRLWSELTQTKHDEVYSSLYIDRSKRILRYLNMGILICSTSGVAGWSIWKDFPVVVCLVVCFASLFKTLSPHLIIDSKQLQQWSDVNVFYSKYYNRLEQLWFDFERGEVSEEQLSSKFFYLKKEETEYIQKIHGMETKKLRRTERKAKEICDNYFRQVFNVK